MFAVPADPASSTVYLDWVRATEPAAKDAAEGLLSELGRAIRRAGRKPGRFVDDMKSRARGLPATHLPWFWDTVGHRLTAYSKRYAATAYGLAREAERTHQLPVDVAYRVANAELFARRGALAGRELRVHQEWLATVMPAAEAHQTFLRFVRAWSESSAPPAPDLHTRLRASAKAAGAGDDDVARVLGEVLVAAKGAEVPNSLLDGAAALLAKYPPDDAVRQGLMDMFPPTNTDGAAFLRLLLASGTIDAMADGRVTPDGGVARWLGRFPYWYGHQRQSGGGVAQTPLAAELFAVVPRLAARLRAAGTPVSIHEGQYNWTAFDADLVDACLAEGIAVHDPGPNVRLKVWGERSRRDLAALAADPVLGKRLERTVHAARGSGTAVTRLTTAPQIADSVRERVMATIGQVAAGGLAAAEDALATLDEMLDPPTAGALAGVDAALAALDLVEPLLRTLRTGLPDELGWPALDAAVADLTADGAEVEGVTSTWPVLTLYTGDRAIAVDHQGRRGDCRFTVPEKPATLVVFHVGGDFLVGWSGKERQKADQAFWVSDPHTVFTPRDMTGMHSWASEWHDLGYQPETGDGGGRYDGGRVLRPGDQAGVRWPGFSQLLGDGTNLWALADTASPRRMAWHQVDPKTGELTLASTPPEFFAAKVPDDLRLSHQDVSLLRLPDGVTESPLGQREGLSGFRVMHPPASGYGWRTKVTYVVEGVDGRRGQLGNVKEYPWGVIRMPGGDADLLLTRETSNAHHRVFCHDAEDGSLLWRVGSFTEPKWRYRGTPFPPPMFWHFLRPRDLVSSRALRTVSREAVQALLQAAPDGAAAVRTALARELPEVTEPRIVAAVVAAVELAAALRGRRERISHGVAVVRSGALVTPPAAAPDTHLLPALRGLILGKVPNEPTMQPALVAAVAADGACLAGRIDDRVRWLSHPASTEDWTVLLGSIDAAVWRLLATTTPDQERTALAALLRTWSDQPFARPGTWRVGTATGAALAPLCVAGQAVVPTAGSDDLVPNRSYRFVQRAEHPAPADAGTVATVVTGDDASRLRQVLALLDERGPLPFDEAAVEAFARRTGVRRAIAALVFAGIPHKRELSGGDLTSRYEAHDRMVRGKPFQATKQIAEEAVGLFRKLEVSGRLRLLAAAVPADPADLWAAGGTVAAAERMADEWAARLGTGTRVDEDAVAQMEKELGFAGPLAAALADPASSRVATTDVTHILAAGRYGGLEVHRDPGDGEVSYRTRGRDGAYSGLAAVLIWALTQRPVGDPAAAGVPELYARLRARLENPELFVELGLVSMRMTNEQRRRTFGPYTIDVRPAVDPFNDDARTPLAFDDGLLIITSGDRLPRPILRPAGFADPAAMARVEALCAEHDLPDLLRMVRQYHVLHDGGLARMVARAADTPVPVGGYENNPALSVPDLVAEVSDTLAVGSAAAALYLQLLTLAKPTDKNIRTWNDWKPARHKAAQAELVARDLVVSEKRSRAGRTAFIPGGWTEVKSPHLPLETRKLAPYLADVTGKKEIDAPVTRLLPPRPLHEMFTDAWQTR